MKPLSREQCFRRFQSEADAADRAGREVMAILGVRMRTVRSYAAADRLLRTASAALRRFNERSAHAEEALRDLLATLGVGPIVIHGVAQRRVSSRRRRYVRRTPRAGGHRSTGRPLAVWTRAAGAHTSVASH